MNRHFSVVVILTIVGFHNALADEHIIAMRPPTKAPLAFDADDRFCTNQAMHGANANPERRNIYARCMLLHGDIVRWEDGRPYTLAQNPQTINPQTNTDMTANDIEQSLNQQAISNAQAYQDHTSNRSVAKPSSDGLSLVVSTDNSDKNYIAVKSDGTQCMTTWSQRLNHRVCINNTNPPSEADQVKREITEKKSDSSVLSPSEESADVSDHGLSKGTQLDNGVEKLSDEQADSLSEKVKSGDRQALARLKSGAATGDPVAQYEIGNLYEIGSGVPKNYEKAYFWYQKAAEQHYTRADISLAKMYYSGKKGVQKDDSKGFELLLSAAKLGNATAQEFVGALYLKGTLGAPKDYSQAFAWISKAAEQGNADAQGLLGAMYGKGLGVQQDFSQALVWLRKAAERGNIGAQKMLPDIEKVVELEKEKKTLEAKENQIWRFQCSTKNSKEAGASNRVPLLVDPVKKEVRSGFFIPTVNGKDWRFCETKYVYGGTGDVWIAPKVNMQQAADDGGLLGAFGAFAAVVSNSACISESPDHLDTSHNKQMVEISDRKVTFGTLSHDDILIGKIPAYIYVLYLKSGVIMRNDAPYGRCKRMQ